MEDKMYEHSRFLLNRLDEQYNKINAKIAVYIAVNTVFLSILGFILKDGKIWTKLSSSNSSILDCFYACSAWICFIAIVLSALSLMVLIIAAIPYMPKVKRDEIANGNCKIAALAIELTSQPQEIEVLRSTLKRCLLNCKCNKNKERKVASMIYFKDISDKTKSFFNDYCSQFDKTYLLSRGSAGNYPDAIIADMISQIYLLACGLSHRNRLLNSAGILMILVVMFLALLLVLEILALS